MSSEVNLTRMQIIRPILVNCFVVPEQDFEINPELVLSDYPIIPVRFLNIDSYQPYSTGKNGTFYTIIFSSGNIFYADIDTKELDTIILPSPSNFPVHLN